MSRRVRLERDTLWLSGADIGALLVGIAVHVVLTRTYAAGDYGRWILLLDLFYLTATFVDLGLPTLIGRDGQRLGDGLRDLVHRSLGIQTRLALPVVLVSAVLGALWVGGGAWWTASAILAISACVQILTYAHRAALRALGESRQEALVRVVDRGATALGIVWVASWAGADPVSFALATLAGPVGALGIALWLGERRMRRAEAGETLETSAPAGRDLVALGLPFLWAAIALVANVRVEKLMLGVLSTPESVATFQIAWLAFIAGYAPILSVRAVMLSWIGEVRHDAELLAHRFHRSRRVLGLCAPAGLIVGLTLGEMAIATVFPTFAGEAIPLFRLMLAVWVFALLASPALTIIQVSDSPRFYPRVLWAGIIADVLACAVLIPWLSTTGAAIAAGVGSIVVWVASERAQSRIHASASPSEIIS